MSTSDSPSSIIERLSAVAAETGAVRKNERNAQQGFQFRGIDTIVNATTDSMRRHQVIVTPDVRHVDREQYTTRSGAVMHSVNVVVGYTFHGPSGDSVTAVVAAEGADAGDKATAKAMSVALRTALLQVLYLPTDEPDPHDADAHERAGGEPVRQRRGSSETAADESPGKTAHRIILEAKDTILTSTGGDAAAAKSLWDACLADEGLVEEPGVWVTDDPQVAMRLATLAAAVANTDDDDEEPGGYA